MAKANPRAGRQGKKPAVGSNVSTATIGLGAAATLAATAAIAVITITGTVDVVESTDSAPVTPNYEAKYDTPIIRGATTAPKLIADAPKSDAPATKAEPKKEQGGEKLSIREKAEREASTKKKPAAKAAPKPQAKAAPKSKKAAPKPKKAAPKPKKASSGGSSSDSSAAFGAVAVAAALGGAYFYSQKDKDGDSAPRQGKPAAPKAVSPKTTPVEELRWAGETSKEEPAAAEAAGSSSDTPANVEEARKWIKDWEDRTGGDEFSTPPENVQEARKWIEDWKERSGGD